MEYQGPRRGSRNGDSGKEPRIETGRGTRPWFGCLTGLKARDHLALDNLLLRKQTRMKEKKQACAAGFRGVGTGERQSWFGLWLCHLSAYKLESLF